ncbi:MAG: acyl-CoA thioesterase [Rhodobacteraceae bacterium]|nr:acyl-CoA thioesterase [Paracoccaceae bacterium]
MSYSFPQKILFRHCDPAGIVYYPRYFEMINDCVEAFFKNQLNWSFVDLHRSGGIPTVEITVQFKTPSRLGEEINTQVRVTKIGRTSLDLSFRAVCDQQVRFEAESTLVAVDAAASPIPWPDHVRNKICTQMKENTDAT